MDLNDMYYFTLVVKNNGFTAAERLSGIPKSKLSRKVGKLEKYLGVRLINRNTRRLELTAAGRDYYNHCLVMVEQAEMANASVKNLQTETRGIVRLSCPNIITHYQLVEILPQFMRDYPKVEVCLSAVNTPVDHLDDLVDIAIVIPPILKQYSRGLVVSKLCESRMILVASPEYLKNYGHPSHPEEISTHQTIASERDKLSGLVTWMLWGPEHQEARIHIFPRFRSYDIMSQLTAALNDFGILLVSEVAAAKYINASRLVHIMPQWQASPSAVMAAFLNRQGLLPPVRALLDYLKKYMPIYTEQYLKLGLSQAD